MRSVRHLAVVGALAAAACGRGEPSAEAVRPATSAATPPEPEPMKRRQVEVPGTVPIGVDLATMMRAYEADARAADALYRGKVFTEKVTLEDIGEGSAWVAPLGLAHGWLRCLATDMELRKVRGGGWRGETSIRLSGTIIGKFPDEVRADGCAMERVTK